MKKSLKGFTLIELVIVMAILTIIMAGLMQFFGPVRNAYRDATYYEAKRVACNAVSRYMTESLRYAQYLGVYGSTETVGGVLIGSNETGAKNAAQALLNSITTDVTTLTSDQITAIKNSIQVIAIDYSKTAAPAAFNSTFDGKEYSGRLWRYKDLFGTSVHSHMALGKAYYGRNSFGINATFDESDKLLSFVTATAGTSLSTNQTNIVDSSNKVISTEGTVNMQNITSGSGTGKMYGTDAKKWSAATPPVLENGTDSIPDILQTGTLASASFSGQYFFAYLPAKDYPYV
jgi:prepilin-type N-terminal cleavage/methylation domain-containing protein